MGGLIILNCFIKAKQTCERAASRASQISKGEAGREREAFGKLEICTELKPEIHAQADFGSNRNLL
jgi:hypothetical protein